MPQASEDLRSLMFLMFGSSISEGKPVNYLVQKGYVLTKNYEWKLPKPDHFIGEKEELCIRFLIDEWDFGGIERSMEINPSWSAADLRKTFLCNKNKIIRPIEEHRYDQQQQHLSIEKHIQLQDK